MFSLNRYKNQQEPVLEPLFRQLRFGVAKKDLERILTKKTMILDFGCGPEAKFFYYLMSEKIPFKHYVGFDPLARKNKKNKSVEITSNWKRISDQKYDLITMFAVLEHLPYPNYDYRKIASLLRPGGHLIITTPTKQSKQLLEFLSYKLKIVSKREIEEHVHYFSLEEIRDIFARYNLSLEKAFTFELNMNNYEIFEKK